MMFEQTSRRALAAKTSSPPDDDTAHQRRIVDALHANLRAANGSVRLVETHISFVLLTGPFAYKIKKAVRLPFLDFSTLAARQARCEDELRLNRRLAPELYLDVVPITGTADAPTIGGAGPVLEYAVRMRQFPDDSLLSEVVARGSLTPAHVDALAARVARFHAAAPVASSDSPFGDPGAILELALDNYSDIRRFANEVPPCRKLDALRAWTEREHATVRHLLEDRRHTGAVRECHGDLHLGNIALVNGEPTVFDCIEFSEEMRWIDTMSEISFVVMDLAHGQRTDLGHRFLNAYLELSGDYGGAAVLRYYLVYRAMVRAKIAWLRASQVSSSSARSTCIDEFNRYLTLASAYAAGRPPASRSCTGRAARQDDAFRPLARAHRRNSGAHRRRAEASFGSRCRGADRIGSRRRALCAGSDPAHLPARACVRGVDRRGRVCRPCRWRVPATLAARELRRAGAAVRGVVSDRGLHRFREHVEGTGFGESERRPRCFGSQSRRAGEPARHRRAALVRRASVHDDLRRRVTLRERHFGDCMAQHRRSFPRRRRAARFCPRQTGAGRRTRGQGRATVPPRNVRNRDWRRRSDRDALVVGVPDGRPRLQAEEAGARRTRGPPNTRCAPPQLP